ncbi:MULTISPECIES: hypothetical protein [Gluconobacter]|uniref:Uncharacterized protein n=1 Tax=Gluconobacter cerinus TaxID=38307 RepID=A0A1B6VKN6_9PROT|nr:MULTISPECIES: hypothetical protein [Gluconobacter]MBM3098784.1 hypothetical protein [Gluconobacter cerinus]MBS0982967.1 hypothetical protein [Gluconobacter cerinus]MBS0994193.1 hypothetical protein [Gluconobacter cerinus]MBS1022421.1 hypothetical protein [Gluconobacter cerinus]MBS1023617.1 hypothetical protein [Gluconobacter cerinus]
MNQPTKKQPHELWRETLMTAWNDRIGQDKSSGLHLLFASTEQADKRRTSQSHQRS